MKSICNVLHGLKPVMLMVMVQVASTIVNVLYKLAINDGMSVTVATAYRLAFASAFIVPLALISERGSLFQNLFYGALALTSATFVSAIYNLVPAITFILAIFSGNKLVGVLCAIASCFSYALWLILQGIVGSGLEIVVIAWCIHMRGPLFASVFNPLMLVLVAVAASLMLNENLYLGSVVGAVMIVCGLYMVLWGKRKEMKNMTQLVPSEILEEAEAIEVVVDNDKCDYHNQTSTIKNVDKDLDYL
ncbi:hypothetical protein TanjilG_08963 [Lupinus angustifolius]|uniref:Uncharacterized protein n=1 Tax=Lupinus angustifolius TaxID=3871 RepID=A0A4P1QPB1_LUPAN|nr:hypothetical protein TanjilG_08963 [Lupinus angustifolius]